MTQTDNDALVRGLEAWLHTVDDQDIAYFGTVILTALRSPAPVVDGDAGCIDRGHICKHGIRWPHACGPCDEATRPQPTQRETLVVARALAKLRYGHPSAGDLCVEDAIAAITALRQHSGESGLREERDRYKAALRAEDEYWAASRALACALPRLRGPAQDAFSAATRRREEARAALGGGGEA